MLRRLHYDTLKVLNWKSLAVEDTSGETCYHGFQTLRRVTVSRRVDVLRVSMYLSVHLLTPTGPLSRLKG